MAEITAQMVKQLREETGAAVLGCKQALEQFEGDFDKAKAYLAEKGLATAKKKAGRTANEGLIETYTHTGGRVGVMLELNCESDFVANTPAFQELAHNIALHIAFANPPYLKTEDVPAEVMEEQSEAFKAEAIASGKPENVVDRIVEGRMEKWYSENVLLNQPFVKDGDITVNDLIVQAVASLKENIVLSRYVRFELGETPMDEEDSEE